MELYTSLTRLKMAMNDGELPPMTELTARAKGFLDPRYTPGMGALEEHPSNGLRCPVRGCGKHFHELSRHLSAAHANIGGAPVIRELLDIPRSVSMTTKRAQERRRAACYTSNIALQSAALQRPSGSNRTRAAREAVLTKPDARHSLAARNMHERCDRQLGKKLKALERKLGRVPNRSEFTREYGYALWAHIYGVYGPWLAFVRAMGYPAKAA